MLSLGKPQLERLLETPQTERLLETPQEERLLETPPLKKLLETLQGATTPQAEMFEILLQIQQTAMKPQTETSIPQANLPSKKQKSMPQKQWVEQ